ncbi:SAM-dependent methyltransferase [Aquabacterium sp. J223]|uniref:SAM-dependent methyltransferase n=1 Tax=Aquabacterium sp. J223 TaxID=2898431 RepID=UPI0021ADBB84|nr:SAM-dependent methyltransferase [Aquabacterium sp. J223]UUX96783.1 SAM-dependent methyltransferase [Aquabacterium sp. J223]
MTSTAQGRLLLVPNTLDLGGAPQPLDEVLPDGVLRLAAGLTHWVVENAKSARALLNRIAARHPLALPLQALDIRELPRPPKGPPAAAAAADLGPLLAPALAGHDVGLLSEAGLPAVADPGADLVAEAHRRGIVVQAMSGPSSLMLALCASGLNGQSFAFVGYLPQAPDARLQRLRELQAASRQHRQTQLFIETPYRNAALLQAALQALDGRTRLSVSVGLTLPGGWTRTDTVDGWRTRPAALPERVPAVFALLA